MTHVPRHTRILFSEGSSLSARQTLTALGSLGYRIDVCDPNPYCLCRFSRFQRQMHQFPGMARDPQAYLDRVLGLLAGGAYDVLLPTHEQTYLFSRVQASVGEMAGLAVPPFDSIQQMQSKIGFAQELDALGLPQPSYRVTESPADLEAMVKYPFYVKASYSTAGRGVWPVCGAQDLRDVVADIEQRDLWQHGIMAQQAAEGLLCQAQAVFDRGTLVCAHCTTQRAVGVGGSQAARGSVDHPMVIEHLQALGRHLDWHGAMALDYLYDQDGDGPAYIECNPRLVEPMNGVMGGVNLPEMMVRLSLGESLAGQGLCVGKAGVNTHSVMSVMMGQAEQGGNRRDMLRILGRAMVRRGVFGDSREDLTPPGLDWKSLMLPTAAALMLTIQPTMVHGMAGGTISHYSVTPQAAQVIDQIQP